MAEQGKVIQDALKQSAETALEEDQAELTSQIESRIQELRASVVTINNATFALKEFSNEDAEHCDKWLERNGYSEIRIKITKWRGEFEQHNPENYSENRILAEQIKALQKRLDRLVNEYQDNPTDELDDEMMKVANKIDTKTKRQSDLYIEQLEPIQRMASTNRELAHEEAMLFYEYCFHLGVRQGLDVGEYDSWQSAVSEDNLDAARKVVEEGKELTRLTRDLKLLKATEPPKAKPSASGRKSANSRKSSAPQSS